MRQYRCFKEQYPDYILFLRMGDFYEMFYGAFPPCGGAVGGVHPGRFPFGAVMR